MAAPAYNEEMLTFMRELLADRPVTRRGLVQKLLQDDRVASALASSGVKTDELLGKLTSEESAVGARYKEVAGLQYDTQTSDAAYELLGLYVNPAYAEYVQGGAKPSMAEMSARMDAFVPLVTYASKVLRTLARELPEQRDGLVSAAEALASAA